MKFVPDEFRQNAHHWLILHGRYVCVARAPKCPECVIRDLCDYRAQDARRPDAAARDALTACSPRAGTQARRFLIDAWGKYRAGEPLSALERQAASLIALHPEYHALLEAPERHLERDYAPESGDDQSVPASVAASRRRRAARDRPAARASARTSSGCATARATSTRRCTRRSNAWAR